MKKHLTFKSKERQEENRLMKQKNELKKFNLVTD